jgi:hypothetical protein
MNDSSESVRQSVTQRVWARVKVHALAVPALLLAAFVGSADAAVPNPVVTGPIPSVGVPGDPARNYAFFSSDHDLKAAGYIEEEYFIEGVANRYNTPTAATGSVRDSNHPYRTRIVVRRPANQRDFNGTVLVEWYNVTNGFDAENIWFFNWEHVLRAGYAWVGVSAQRVGVDAMKTWSPSRYGALDVTQGGTITDDGLSYDIFSQAGQAIRSPVGINVLGNLKPKTYIATGESQSAGRLATYANSVMPLGNVWDGVFLLSTFGSLMRTDLQVPVFKVLFEWDTETGEAAVRQPDTNVFHRWEVAGTAHVDHHLRLSREPLELRDNGTSSEATLAPQCGVPRIGSRVPNNFVVDAAFDHLVRWVREGTPPPTSPLFEMASIGPGSSSLIARDSFNMAKGAIRLSQIAVPIAANVGRNSGPSACARWGYNLPFDLATLESLYGSHARYVNAVLDATLSNLAHGFVLKPDATQTALEALQTRVGRGGGGSEASNPPLPAALR